jgi:hypothetical protein
MRQRNRERRKRRFSSECTKACMHACNDKKTTNEYRTARSCPCYRKAEVEAVPRTKGGRMRCIDLGCAAFQGNIDRDLDVATKNMVRAGRVERRNEGRPLDLQRRQRQQTRVQWRQHYDHGLTFVRPWWKRPADSCPYSSTSSGVVLSLCHM